MNIKVTASTNKLGETTKKVLTEVGEKVGLEEAQAEKAKEEQ